jgi:hypothetical protein
VTKISYAGYRFPPEIIQQAIWLYLRFTLSLRDVEDLLAERGIGVSYETVRRWANHFGPLIAADWRKRRPKPHTTWRLDEVYLKIDGRMLYLWRAVDAMGVAKIDAMGTEAIRRASNGPALAAAIAAESGLEVRILSRAEEARFAALGVISGFFRPVGLVGDMGGGSLEVAEALDDHVGDRWVSQPLGALPAEATLADGLPEAERAIDAMLQEGLPPALGKPVFHVVGGGGRALAEAHMEAAGAPVKVVHRYTLAIEETRNFATFRVGL